MPCVRSSRLVETVAKTAQAYLPNGALIIRIGLRVI